MNDSEWDEWHQIARDDTRKVRFYLLAKSANPPISEEEAEAMLDRWKRYGKSMLGTATAAELFVKDAMDQALSIRDGANPS